jgi:hypothetical protein
MKARNDAKQRSTSTLNPPHAVRTGLGVKSRQIHPIIVYPFVQPRDSRHLEALYDGLLWKLTGSSRYATPITVINRQTYHRNSRNTVFAGLIKNCVEKHTQVIHTWSVDSCQMWLHGFGAAFDGRTMITG